MIWLSGRFSSLAYACLWCLLVATVSAQDESVDSKKYKSWLATRPLISKIAIEGNAYFSDAKIKSRLYSRENSFWQFLKGGSRNRVLRYSAYRDTLEVKYIYIREGFIDVGVSERTDIVPKDSSAAVTITIKEGNRFVAAGTRLTADNSLPFYADLSRTAAQFDPGEPIDPFKLRQVVFDLKTIFANNGYPYATVTEVIDSAAGLSEAIVAFETSAGALVRFGDLIVSDLKYYSPYLARREIAFKSGELYRREKIIESQKRLYSTNLFNSVSLDIARSGDSIGSDSSVMDTTPDFAFSAIERKPHFVSVKTGASQDSLQDLTWDFTAAWGKRNIFVSRKIELSATFRFIIFTQWRTLYHRYQIKYTEPWFFNIRMPLTLTARFEPGVRSPVQLYRIQTWSISISSRKEWSEKLVGLVTGRYEKVNIYGIEPENQAQFRSEQGIRVRRKVDITIVRDARIDKFMPKSGSLTTYFAQFVGGLLGGDDSFIKLEFSWARYQSALGWAVYATRLKAGWVKEFGASHEVPTIDRFYLGGANSIRGFKENSIGPYNQLGTNVGSNAYAIFNQELRFPLFWKLWGSVFTDLGNGWESFSRVRVDDVLFAYGAGVQFVSPAGPVRFDYAHRLENGIYKADDRFHVTILYAF